MSIQDIISWLDQNPQLLLSFLASILVISLLGLLFIKAGKLSRPVSYLYTFLVYAFAIPGLLALIILLYNFFFLRSNLLELGFISNFLPLVALIAGFYIISKTVSFDQIPGFGRIPGLFLIIILSFIVTYVLQKMFFGVLFIGSFGHIILIFIVLLVGFRFAWVKIKGAT